MTGEATQVKVRVNDAPNPRDVGRIIYPQRARSSSCRRHLDADETPVVKPVSSTRGEVDMPERRICTFSGDDDRTRHGH